MADTQVQRFQFHATPVIVIIIIIPFCLRAPIQIPHQTGEISFKVSGLPKMPSISKPELPKGNIELLQGRAEKYFAKKPFLILNYLSCWATVVLSAVTVWYVTSMNSLPSLPTLSLPRFRHGDAHAAQAQMQIDSASEQHDLQFFLIMIVLFVAPLAIMGAAEAQRALTHGDQLAKADAASAQSSAALVKVLTAPVFCLLVASIILLFTIFGFSPRTFFFALAADMGAMCKKSMQ